MSCINLLFNLVAFTASTVGAFSEKSGGPEKRSSHSAGENHPSFHKICQFLPKICNSVDKSLCHNDSNHCVTMIQKLKITHLKRGQQRKKSSKYVKEESCKNLPNCFSHCDHLHLLKTIKKAFVQEKLTTQNWKFNTKHIEIIYYGRQQKRHVHKKFKKIMKIEDSTVIQAKHAGRCRAHSEHIGRNQKKS